MRKSWIIRKDEKAVSPVIATILMVAITVVLAAVLYVMVTGLIGGGGGTAAPALTFTTDTPSAGVWTAEVAVSRAVGLSSYKISLINMTSGAIIIPETALTNTFSQTAAGVTLAFQDIASPSSQQLNGGDKFRLSGIVSPHRYTLNIVWTASGAIIQSVNLPTT